jgi:predicted hydrocarbon binding protein
MNNKLIIAITAVVAAIGLSIMPLAFGLFHAPHEAPKLMINHELQEELDKLYEKHPNITEEDRQKTVTAMANICYNWAVEDDPEAAENPFQLPICRMMVNGIVQGYLENLGYTFEEE